MGCFLGYVPLCLWWWWWTLLLCGSGYVIAVQLETERVRCNFGLRFYSFFNFIVMQCCGLSVNIEPLLYVVGLAISIQNTIHYFLLQVC